MDLNTLPEEQKQKIFTQYFESPLVYGAFREKSHKLNVRNTNNYNKNYLVYQFFIPKDSRRYEEIKKALQKNMKNQHIDKIYLLNEKIYSDEELGVKSSDKLEQIDHKKWLSFKDVFDFIDLKKLDGNVIFCNSDIFFDETIKTLKNIHLHKKKEFVSLLRYEYNNENNLNTCKIFGPRWDSQDTWIIHSSQNVEKQYRMGFDFCFGQPGCDNKILFLMKLLGYRMYNDPKTIRTYHIHNDKGRNYQKNRVQPNYGYLIPANVDFEKKNVHIDYNIMNANCYNFQRYNYTYDHNKFKTYLEHYINKSKPIILPLVDNVVMGGKYHNECFDLADSYFGWEFYGLENRVAVNHSKHIDVNYPHLTSFWTKIPEVYYFVNMKPWTQLLKGKRILLISDYIDSIKMNVKKPVYPVDLYPECKFKYIKSNCLNNQDYQQQFKEITGQMSSMKEGFDIVLFDVGPLNNMLSTFAYNIKKDSIVIGRHLKMHFGVYTKDDETSYPDIFNLYKNKHWLIHNETN